MPRAALRPLDYAALAITLAVCAASVLAAARGSGGEAVVVVTAADAEYIYRLDRDVEIRVRGLKGVSVVQVADGAARFVDSPCANRTCVASAPAVRSGDWAACMPNGVFLRIESARTDAEIDIISF